MSLRDELQSLVDQYGKAVVFKVLVGIPGTSHRRNIMRFGPLASLELSTRTWAALARNGINSVEDALEIVRVGYPECRTRYHLRTFGIISFSELTDEQARATAKMFGFDYEPTSLGQRESGVDGDAE